MDSFSVVFGCDVCVRVRAETWPRLVHVVFASEWSFSQAVVPWAHCGWAGPTSWRPAGLPCWPHCRCYLRRCYWLLYHHHHLLHHYCYFRWVHHHLHRPLDFRVSMQFSQMEKKYSSHIDIGRGWVVFGGGWNWYIAISSLQRVSDIVFWFGLDWKISFVDFSTTNLYSLIRTVERKEKKTVLSYSYRFERVWWLILNGINS